MRGRRALSPIELKNVVATGKGRDYTFFSDRQAAGYYGELHRIFEIRAAGQRDCQTSVKSIARASGINRTD